MPVEVVEEVEAVVEIAKIEVETEAERIARIVKDINFEETPTSSPLTQ